MQISYKPDGEDWVNEQYIGTSFTDTEWSKDSNWNKIPKMSQLKDLNETLDNIIGSSKAEFDKVVGYQAKLDGTTHPDSNCFYGDINIPSFAKKVKYQVINSLSMGVSFLDENNKFISAIPNTVLDNGTWNIVEIPDRAAIFRYTYANDDYAFKIGIPKFEYVSFLEYNLDNEVIELSKDIDLIEKGIQKDITDKIKFSQGYFINVNSGNVNTGVNVSYTEEFIELDGNCLVIAINLISNNVNKSAGMAFYNKDKIFISGFIPPKTAIETFNLYYVEVPNDAVFFRTSAFGQDFMDDYGFKFNCIELLNIPEAIKDVSEGTIGYVDISDEVILSLLSTYINFKNGNLSNTVPDTTNVQASINYIYVKFAKEIKAKFYVDPNINTEGGYAFYDSDKIYISGGSFTNGDIEDYTYTISTIKVPENAVFFRYTVYNRDISLMLNAGVQYLFSKKNKEDKNYRIDRIDITSEQIIVDGDNLWGLNVSKNSLACRIECSFKNKKIRDVGEIAYQGNTSLGMPKKGFTLTFSEKHRFENWIEMDEYHCKGYYSDWLHCRDILANRILEQVLLTRPQNERRPYQINNKFEDNDPELLIDSGALCHIDGFPLELYINGTYWGLYSLNIKKERDNYKLKKSNTDHIQIEASEDTKYITDFDWKKVEIRNPKSDSGNEEFVANTIPNDGEVKTAWVSFLTKLSSVDSESTTKENLKEFLNVQDWIDNILICWFLNHADNWSKNTLYTTWDATHWSPLLYDMDNTFGITDITGGSTRPYDTDTFKIKAYNNCPWLSKIETILADDIKSRYSELRSMGIFSAENVDNMITAWVKSIGTDVYKDDTERWSYPGLGNGTEFVDSQYRMVQWINDRIKFLDEKYNYVK